MQPTHLHYFPLTLPFLVMLALLAVFVLVLLEVRALTQGIQDARNSRHPYIPASRQAVHESAAARHPSLLGRQGSAAGVRGRKVGQGRGKRGGLE